VRCARALEVGRVSDVLREAAPIPALFGEGETQVCICVSIYIYIYIIHICVYLYRYMSVWALVCIYIFLSIYIYMCVCACVIKRGKNVIDVLRGPARTPALFVDGEAQVCESVDMYIIIYIIL